MATALEIFRVLAVEFSAVSDDTAAAWLDMTEPLVSRKRFGRVYNQALALLTAHRMKISGIGSDGGASGHDGAPAQLAAYKAAGVASYSSGGESVSFDNSALTAALSADADYAQTAYGVQYLSLRNLRVVPIINAGEAR
jgi:hypothetical protein